MHPGQAGQKGEHPGGAGGRSAAWIPRPWLETVRRYNEFCAKGLDEDFGKDRQALVPIADHGPYYAIYGQRFSEAALGGVMVDGQCRCIRNDGTPIPGLYAGGDATSAMHIRGRLAVISELTWAVASAYTSGSNAVDYIDQQAQAEKEEWTMFLPDNSIFTPVADPNMDPNRTPNQRLPMEAAPLLL